MVKYVRVKHEPLLAYAIEVMVKAGLDGESAKTEGDAQMWANLRGIDSHGVTRVNMVRGSIKSGNMNPNYKFKVISERAATILIDADRSPGAVSATYAMKLAIEKAKKCGIGWALVRNTETPHSIGHYVEIAIKNNMAGIAATFANPLMTPYGSKAAGLHNGPISFGVPSKNRNAPLLDMATSTVAMGKVSLAKDKRIDIPEGWALDKDGKPTTDPYMAAISTPFGLYKGSGLSFMFECLTGIMAGSPRIAPYLNEGPRPWLQNSIMAAIDISAFSDPDIFAEQVDELIDAIKGLPKAEGFDEIYVPGEIEANTVAERLKSGIPLPPGALETLREAGIEAGVGLPDWLAT